jgi:intracellular sulfur oxidation DsrE/DsrF family protein
MSTSKTYGLILAASLALSVLAPAGVVQAGADNRADPAAARGVKAVKERVVIQVSDGDTKTWNQALNVVSNLKTAYGKNDIEVEIVAFGNGIGMLKAESEVANRIHEALESGTHVAACLNTMRGRKLQKVDMLTGLSYVDSGIVEIIEKQRKGWAVVRP